MNGNKLLLDSNIIIYLSNKVLKISDFANANDTLYISVITYMEILGYRFDSKEEEDFIKNLFSYLPVLHIDELIAEKVIAYKKASKIKLPDAIILATAREYECKLVTKNIADYKGIDEEVELIQPL